MRGEVAPDAQEALLRIEVPSRQNFGARTLRIEAVLDTGFTGHLTLPRVVVERLALPLVGSAESVLADGSVVLEDVCLATVLWHGRERPVRVLVFDATPLIGMALLRGSELRVRAEPGGEVIVEELAD